MTSRPPAKQERPKNAKVAYRGKLFEVLKWRQRLFDGSHTTFEALRRPDTALVLPVTDDGDILFVHETQPGMADMFRVMSGRLERDETATGAAHRELREETGYEAAELRLWDAWQPVNKIDWAVYLFVAHGLRRVGSPKLDAGERLSVRPVHWSRLFETDAPTFDDYEFSYKLFEARSNPAIAERVQSLFTK